MHDDAASGFGRRANLYHNSRSKYHPAVIQRLCDRYLSGRVLELGAATGVFTEHLLAAGLEPLVVEPSEEMRQFLVSRLPSAGVVAGVAENIPVSDGSMDVVVAAQSFHRFDRPTALDEIHRVLTPGGAFVTVWNVQSDFVDWVSEVIDISDRYGLEKFSTRYARWRRPVDIDPRFELAEEFSVQNPQHATPDVVIGRALSSRRLVETSDEEKAAIVAEISEILKPLGSSFAVPQECQFQAWRKVEIAWPSPDEIYSPRT